MTHPRPLRAERRTLSQAVTEALLDRIRGGEFRPGDRLPTEKELMAEYGIGRNVAREAAQGMAAMGLIEIRPGRGATLLAVEAEGMDAATASALLSEQALENLYEFRRLIEIESAARAAERATDGDVAAIREALGRWRDEIAQPEGPVFASDDEFHAAIVRASHNPVFVTMFDAVVDLVRRGRQISRNVPWAIERARGEHEQILEAIAARDPEQAAASMRIHLDGAIEAIREGLAAERAAPRRRGGPAGSTAGRG